MKNNWLYDNGHENLISDDEPASDDDSTKLKTNDEIYKKSQIDDQKLYWLSNMIICTAIVFICVLFFDLKEAERKLKAKSRSLGFLKFKHHSEITEYEDRLEKLNQQIVEQAKTEIELKQRLLQYENAFQVNDRELDLPIIMFARKELCDLKFFTLNSIQKFSNSFVLEKDCKKKHLLSSRTCFCICDYGPNGFRKIEQTESAIGACIKNKKTSFYLKQFPLSLNFDV